MTYYYESELYHHGIKGQKWGIRRYQNEDGTLTEEGKRRYLERTDARGDRLTADEKVHAREIHDALTEYTRKLASEYSEKMSKEVEKTEEYKEWKAKTKADLLRNDGWSEEEIDDILNVDFFFDDEDNYVDNDRAARASAKALESQELKRLYDQYIEACSQSDAFWNKNNKYVSPNYRTGKQIVGNWLAGIGGVVAVGAAMAGLELLWEKY